MNDLHDTTELNRIFTQKCLKKFGLLADYDFELTSIEENGYGVEVTYKNQTTGIKVSFEGRENAIFVYLIQLINGKIPAYLDNPSRWFYLDNIVKLRSPSTSLPRKEFGNWLTPSDIDYFLTMYADALKEFGKDVLFGDFSVFTELSKQIDRPRLSSNGEGVRAITSNDELEAQKEKLTSQIVEYYDTYFSELRDQLQNPDLFSEAVPNFLKGYKRIVSIGGHDGIVVVHFSIEKEITLSQTGTGNILRRYPSRLDASEDNYEFMQFPDWSIRDIITFISEGEDISAEIPIGEVFWGIRSFNAPQEKVDPTTGELAWQAPWTRLVCSDLYHLPFWEDTKRAKKEAKEEIEPYIQSVENLWNTEFQPPYPDQWSQVSQLRYEVQEEQIVDEGVFSKAS